MAESIDIQAILRENEELKQINAELAAKLDKINHHESKKRYYENNKEIVMQKASERLKQIKETNPEIIKEYRRRAYLKSKAKKEEALKSQNI
jgi:cell division septum initiation protein DivIVA